MKLSTAGGGVSTWEVRVGDCVELMAGLLPNSVDAIVTDPPYDLLAPSRNGSGRSNEPDTPGGRHSSGGFMGLAWDATGVAFRRATWGAALWALKPGGHLLAFGGCRTYHRMACAVEDAGFEIRDQIAWLFGRGFPKSLDIAKAIDKAHGAEGQRGDVKSDQHAAMIRTGRVGGGKHVFGVRAAHTDPIAISRTAREYIPATPEARRWQGWGTALKPAHEPIVVARKPLSERTVAANVQRWGTGALNIDSTRLLTADNHARFNHVRTSGTSYLVQRENGYIDPGGSGRWPPNVALDEEAAALLDEQTGDLRPGVAGARTAGSGAMFDPGSPGHWGGYGDRGGASRFFYSPKADRTEREAGLDTEERPLLWSSGEQSLAGLQSPNTNRMARNYHPTVKPIALMEWLIRLVTPPGGLVLDPFAGSGSTGIAAMRAGCDFLGFEIDPDYADIARRRMEWYGSARG